LYMSMITVLDNVANTKNEKVKETSKGLMDL
jgi:hypothetical protein